MKIFARCTVNIAMIKMICVTVASNKSCESIFGWKKKNLSIFVIRRRKSVRANERHWTFSSNFFMLHVNCSLKRLFVKTHFLIKIILDVKLGSSESLGKLTRSAKISPAAKLINRNQFKSLDWKLSKTRFDYISAVAFLMAKGKANSIQSISMFRLLPAYLTPIALIIRKNDIFRVWFWRFMGYFNEELTSRSVIDLFW